MQFLHPWFLWALAAVLIPIIIHLFNFRRFKTVYFSNVRFLRQVQEETASRSKLKHLLVLASRILAVVFLVFAFAQPFIPDKKGITTTGKKFVSVYIDNSFSMNAVSGGRSLLDKAKLSAKEIAKNYSADDEFQLLTNDFEGKHQRLVGKEEFLSMADEVELSPAVRNLSEISKRQSDVLNRENGKNKVAYLLSDYQKNMGQLSVDSSIAYNLIPLAADAQANVYIDTCWFADPVQLLSHPASLIVKISNSGEKKVEGNRLVLKLNGQTKSMSEFSVTEGSYILDTLQFTATQANWNKAELTIQDYPITYDDNYFIAFNVVEKVKVLSVYDSKPNQFLDALFKNQDEFEYLSINANSFQPEVLRGNQLVVLDGLNEIPASLAAAINTYLADGGAVAVFPSTKIQMESYNRFLNNLQSSSITGFTEQGQDMASINVQQNVFKDVFESVPNNINLPHVNKYYTFSHSSSSTEETILALKDGSSFFSLFPYQSGSLYVCASPLDKESSELPVHAIFVPMLYKMAVLNIKGSSISYFIGDKTRIEVDAPATSTDKVYKLKGDKVELIPEQFAVGGKMLLGLNGEIKNAGFYSLTMDGTTNQDWLALNFDRKESDLKFTDAAELKAKYNLPNVNVVNGANIEVAALVKELDRGTPLWKWCLMLTLLFLAIEVALLRFWKV